MFAAACSDGGVKFFLRNGRVDKTINDAHRGAVTSVNWTNDGTHLLTAGEDGVVKSWTRSGHLKSTLASGDIAVYSCAWSPEASVNNGNGHVVFARGKTIRIVGTAVEGTHVSTQSKYSMGKKKAWKAHDGVVLSVDWCFVNDRIISGSEDRTYKVWDLYGQLLYISPEREHAITSVRWAPSGNVFAAGSFDCVWLCDRDGWTEGGSDTGVGSALSLGWSNDGTSIAGCGGKKPFVFTATVLDLTTEWAGCALGLNKPNEIKITDNKKDAASGDGSYTLRVKGRVSKLSFRHDYLLVVVGSVISVYKRNVYSSPVATADVADCVTFMTQSAAGFAVVTSVKDQVGIYKYDGSKVRDLSSDGLFVHSICDGVFTLAPEVCAFIDKSSATSASVSIVDLASGKKFPQLKHRVTVSRVQLNQVGAGGEFRLIAFTDANRDLWIRKVTGSNIQAPIKLSGMVDSFMWSDTCDSLCAINGKGTITAWRCPSVFFADHDLVLSTTQTKEVITQLGKAPCTIIGFDGARVTIKRDDGALIITSLSPNSVFFPQLHKHARGTTGTSKEWDKAIRLCRFAKDIALWSSLAVYAMDANELDAASIAYANLEQIEKVKFIQKVKKTPAEPLRNAELKLFKRQIVDAENVLISNGFIYRAVDLSLRVFDWDKALSLALEHRTHVDTVLYFRSEYLKNSKKKEDKPAFIAAAREVEVVEKQIKLKIIQEREREKTYVAMKTSVAAKTSASADKTGSRMSSKTSRVKR